jgi:membrane fusion protein, multidrug efflux system
MTGNATGVRVAHRDGGKLLMNLLRIEQVVVDEQYKLKPGTHVTILLGRAAEEAAAQSALQDPIP